MGLIQKAHLLFHAWIIEEFSNSDTKENNYSVDTAHMYFLNTVYIAKGIGSVDTYTLQYVLCLSWPTIFVRQSMIYDPRLFELIHGTFHRYKQK